VSRFKGQVSQGLALPLAVLPAANYAVGDDVTELTGIRKYEKPLRPISSAWRKALFLRGCRRRTNRTCVRSRRRWTSSPDASASSRKRWTARRRRIICVAANSAFALASRTVGRSGQHVRARGARTPAARGLATLGGDFALQGEVHGEGIQGNHLGVKGVSFAAFNLFDIAAHDI